MGKKDKEEYRLSNKINKYFNAHLVSGFFLLR